MSHSVLRMRGISFQLQPMKTLPKYLGEHILHVWHATIIEKHTSKNMQTLQSDCNI